MTIANAMTIAGSDSGGGAGIQADIKSMSANGVFAASILTALTAQNTKTVTAIHPVPVDFIRAQIDAVMDDIDIHAIKVGMLATSSVIECVAEALDARASGIPVVVDPVMVAKGGAKLLQDEAIVSMRQTLIPMATLITPNLPEAAVLLDCAEARNVEEMTHQLHALSSLIGTSVLLKGGHLQGPVSVDLLLTTDGALTTLETPRHDTPNTHGTGCTLSSAIAAHLAQGCTLEEAVKAAKSYIQQAIAHSDRLAVGQGHGPVDHFFASRQAI